MCKLIMQDWCTICSVALCFEEETPRGGVEKVSHLSQPTQLNTHEHSLGIIKAAPSTESFSLKTSSSFTKQAQTQTHVDTTDL